MISLAAQIHQSHFTNNKQALTMERQMYVDYGKFQGGRIFEYNYFTTRISCFTVHYVSTVDQGYEGRKWGKGG
jgi:hypothetical protein